MLALEEEIFFRFYLGCPNTKASPQPPQGTWWLGGSYGKGEQTPVIPGKSQEKSDEGSKSAPPSEMNIIAKEVHILLFTWEITSISNISGDINDYVCSPSRSENQLTYTK
jgi:hypothetical protein